MFSRIGIKRSIVVAATLAVTGFTASTAHAGYTNFKMAPKTESGIQQIIEHTYGGTWAPASTGKNYVGPNGMTAERVSDNFGLHALDLDSGDITGASDATWTGGTFTAHAVAKFSMNTQTFGYTDGDGFHSLFTADGLGFNVTSTLATVGNTNGPFRFERTGDSGTQTTWHGDNLDGRDHMLTYKIDGLSGTTGPVYLLFWEDLDKTSTLPAWRSSSDFNDLVVELRGFTLPAPAPNPGGNGGNGGGVTAAPLPAPGIAGGIVLAAVLTTLGTKRSRPVIA